MVSTEVMKNCSSTSLKEVKRTTSSSQLPLKKKADEKFVPLDFVSVEQMTSRKADRASFEFEPLWAGGNKSEPWWRMVDKDDLALLVAQKSLENVENCDLPQPNQRVFVTNDPFASNENMNSDRIFEPLFNAKLNASIRGANEYSDIATTDRTFDSRDLPSCERGYMPRDSENRHSCKHGYGEEEPESNQPSDNEPTRDQLFEALRHSQTRARKAEIAAQKAYKEKEHIVKILFRQTSQLFAYKQLMQMLQAENFCLKLKITNHISNLIPVTRMPLKGMLSDINKNSKRKKNRCSIAKFALVFPIGLGLASVGFLFG